jgi:hypothetical protein
MAHRGIDQLLLRDGCPHLARGLVRHAAALARGRLRHDVAPINNEIKIWMGL